MDDPNMDWLTYPGHETGLNRDFAIRQFCPARAEEDRAEPEPLRNDFKLYSPTENSEMDEFFESVFNTESPDNPPGPGDDPAGSRVDPFLGPSLGQGLHLVHMLLGCAEAIGCRDAGLARALLAQISASVSPLGDPLQRVSHCFATGLNSRLSLLQHVKTNGTIDIPGALPGPGRVARADRAEAFRLLHRATPFVAFGFTAANEAISESATGRDYLHVVDLGSESVLQWPSLIQALGSRPGGPPKGVRITALVDDHGLGAELESGMEPLVEEAGTLGFPLRFQTISGPITPAVLTGERLGARPGEALAVNGFLRLHRLIKERRGSLKGILAAVRELGPAVLTVVEPDASHNGPFFLGRFVESLHYYSAVFDALEAGLPRDSPERAKIEAVHFGEEIRNIVACEGSGRVERHERAGQWRRQLGRAGFRVTGLKCMTRVRSMLADYGCNGYTLAAEKGCLLLGWKGRPVLMASAWQLHNVASS